MCDAVNAAHPTGAPSRPPFGESANATADCAVLRGGPSAVLDAASAPTAGLRAYMADSKIPFPVLEKNQAGASTFTACESGIIILLDRALCEISQQYPKPHTLNPHPSRHAARLDGRCGQLRNRRNGRALAPEVGPGRAGRLRRCVVIVSSARGPVAGCIRSRHLHSGWSVGGAVDRDLQHTWTTGVRLGSGDMQSARHVPQNSPATSHAPRHALQANRKVGACVLTSGPMGADGVPVVAWQAINIIERRCPKTILECRTHQVRFMSVRKLPMSEVPNRTRACGALTAPRPRIRAQHAVLARLLVRPRDAPVAAAVQAPMRQQARQQVAPPAVVVLPMRRLPIAVVRVVPIVSLLAGIS